MTVFLVIMLVLFAFVIGHFAGAIQMSRYWRAHATNTDGKGVIHYGHQFYYVVPEKEYVDLTVEHRYLEKIRLECAVNGG